MMERKRKITKERRWKGRAKKEYFKKMAKEWEKKTMKKNGMTEEKEKKDDEKKRKILNIKK